MAKRMRKAELDSIEDYLRFHIELAREDGLEVRPGAYHGWGSCCLLGMLERLDPPATALNIASELIPPLEAGFEGWTGSSRYDSCPQMRDLGERLRAECDAYLEAKAAGLLG